MAEYESERERLAMITELLLHIEDAEARGKTSFTADELKTELLAIAREVKQHK